MFRRIAPALILSFAAHVVAAAGYWLWGGDRDGHEALPVVEVALVMDAAQPAPDVEAVVTEPAPVDPMPRATPEAVSAPAPKAEPQPVVDATPQPRPVPRPSAAPPVVSAPEPEPAPIDPGLLVSVEQAYKSALQAEIARHRSYPRIARDFRQEGTVEVGFVVLADGRLIDIELIDSSGYELLDHAAIKAVRDVRQFRPIPSELARERWNLSVPLNFRLL